jgi:nitroreductase
VSFLDLVKKRRSVRKYLERPVPREAVVRCLEAARLSPSACNSQPWRFLVLDDPELKSRLSDSAFSGIHSINSFAGKAPVLVVIVTERSSFASSLGSCFRGVQYSLIDIGIAGEHFILQAEEEGLGTCWLGWFNEKEVKKVLGLTRNSRVDVIISLGYPVETERPGHTRKTLSEMSRFVPDTPVFFNGREEKS